jgi:fatty acid desaturase
MADRENIARNLKEYNEINTKNEDQGLYLYQNQTSYMFWTVLCFISIAVVVKFSMFPNAPFKWSKFILWTIIVSIMLILVNFLKLAYGFILFIIVSIIVLLIILKIIPTP